MFIIDGQAVDAAAALQRFVLIVSAFRNLFVPSHSRGSALPSMFAAGAPCRG
jgi:hypothetical protein